MSNKKLPKKSEINKEAEAKVLEITQAYQSFMSSEHGEVILSDLLAMSGISRYVPAHDQQELWKQNGVREFMFNQLLRKCSMTPEMVQQMLQTRVNRGR